MEKERDQSVFAPTMSQVQRTNNFHPPPSCNQFTSHSASSYNIIQMQSALLIIAICVGGRNTPSGLYRLPSRIYSNYKARLRPKAVQYKEQSDGRTLRSDCAWQRDRKQKSGEDIDNYTFGKYFPELFIVGISSPFANVQIIQICAEYCNWYPSRN